MPHYKIIILWCKNSPVHDRFIFSTMPITINIRMINRSETLKDVPMIMGTLELPVTESQHIIIILL